MERQLDEIRIAIDETDNQLLEIFNKRMELVREVGRIKRSAGTVIYRPEREKSILDRLNGLNQGLIGPEAIEAIFTQIFAVSRNFELPERVAYLGPEGSFTHQAAESRFGAISDYVSLSSIQAVFESVMTNRVKFGVIPIENNREGSVSESIDLLGTTDVKIVAEIPMHIHFALSSQEDEVSKITKIYSKDIAFRQCKKFIQEYFGTRVELVPVTSTSKAARLAKETPGSAAICAQIAAKIADLPVLFNNIEDSSVNRTRFLIISKDFMNLPAEGTNKTTVIAKVADKAGSLAGLLQDFNIARVNLCKVDSRPSKEDAHFKYWFLIDFDGHFNDENVKYVLEKNTETMTLLGSYVKQC